MKKSLFFAILPLLALLWNCSGSSLVNISATGKPYEVFVVTEKPIWNGAAGDSLRMVMNEEVLWLNQPEPLFDLFNITPQALNDITKRHRNLLFLNVDKSADTTTFTVKTDRWASGQIVMDITAPSAATAADYIAQNSLEIMGFIGDVEQNRMNQRAKKYNDPRIEKLILEKFGIKMSFPRGYRVANDAEDFLWLTYEMPIASQGVVIYSFDRPTSTTEKLSVLEQRNLAVQKIPGPVDGSYMTSDMMFTPESTSVEINDIGWILTQGFWRVEGDFMGGPFINYATFNKNTGRYIAFDMYVYSPSPRYPKRNYVRQLESLMLGVSIAE